ncbi:histone H4-K16 acetylation [Desmophyllum pertusum]|uniref:Histone H4-K16 acetylation n=1 Tax=Desmophyllum pertusum TaxID=174260 RepID=A0A9W9ZZA1_9CNID|nr:histone H4-K16 acetylation [Desmophyllum pertusum]
MEVDQTKKESTEKEMEDTSDDMYICRHGFCEEHERKRFLGLVKKKRKRTSRQSSELSLPDPPSPLGYPDSQGGTPLGRPHVIHHCRHQLGSLYHLQSLSLLLFLFLPLLPLLCPQLGLPHQHRRCRHPWIDFIAHFQTLSFCIEGLLRLIDQKNISMMKSSSGRLWHHGQKEHFHYQNQIVHHSSFLLLSRHLLLLFLFPLQRRHLAALCVLL